MSDTLKPAQVHANERNTCECYHDCRNCSLSGDWHVHAGERCLVHPEAPGDW